ncbi:MAG: efflux RND transporter periplasmic adaptor subunit [Planctomycetaceae bacterium]
MLEISREHLRALVGNSAVDDATGDQPDDDSLSTLVLRSPIDGLVEDIFVARGERVAPGKRMFVVADTSTLWVRAMVHERQWTAVDVADGQTVSVTVPGALVHDATATINHVGATVEAESRSVPLVAELDNDDAHYKPGMFVWVDLPQGVLRDAIAVPAEAVMRHDGRTFVFVPEGGGRFRRRDVQTGIETDALLEVTSGLDEGDEVVSRGAFLLKSRLLLAMEPEGGSAAARTPPGTASPGGPGRHQPRDVGHGEGGGMPSLAVKPEARCSRA